MPTLAATGEPGASSGALDRAQSPDRRYRARLVAAAAHHHGRLPSGLARLRTQPSGGSDPGRHQPLADADYVRLQLRLHAGSGDRDLDLAGRELGIRQLLPEDEREIDDRDTSIIRLLGITLLPFLGMYAAFGQVAEAAQ